VSMLSIPSIEAFGGWVEELDVGIVRVGRVRGRCRDCDEMIVVEWKGKWWLWFGVNRGR
jgi:hypothetical protein